MGFVHLLDTIYDFSKLWGGGEDYAYGRIVWGRLTKGDWY